MDPAAAAGHLRLATAGRGDDVEVRAEHLVVVEVNLVVEEVIHRVARAAGPRGLSSLWQKMALNSIHRLFSSSKI